MYNSYIAYLLYDLVPRHHNICINTVIHNCNLIMIGNNYVFVLISF